MIDNYMLYKNLPTLDLHGENRFNAVVLADEFIKDNLKLGNELILIVHGIGTGILKESIHRFLKTKREVKAYRTDIFNSGVTVIELDTKKRQRSS